MIHILIRVEKYINEQTILLNLFVYIDLTEDEDLQGMIIELKESGHKTKELKRSQSNSSRT